MMWARHCPLAVLAAVSAVAARPLGGDAAEQLVNHVPSIRLFGVTVHQQPPVPRQGDVVADVVSRGEPSSASPWLTAASRHPSPPREVATELNEAAHINTGGNHHQVEHDSASPKGQGLRREARNARRQFIRARASLAAGRGKATEETVQAQAQKYEELLRASVAEGFGVRAGGVPPPGYVHPKAYGGVASALRRKALAQSTEATEHAAAPSHTILPHETPSSSAGTRHEPAQPLLAIHHSPADVSLATQVAVRQRRNAGQRLWTARIRGDPPDKIQALAAERDRLSRSVAVLRFQRDMAHKLPEGFIPMHIPTKGLAAMTKAMNRRGTPVPLKGEQAGVGADEGVTAARDLPPYAASADWQGGGREGRDLSKGKRKWYD